MKEEMRKALIVIAAGLALHQILFWQCVGLPIQVIALALASVGGALYAQALGRKPIWGLLAFLASPGVLIIFLVLKEKQKQETGTSNQASEAIAPQSGAQPQH